MYVTRPLSLYRRSPHLIPEGPNSGYLVIQDDESTPTCCFGICNSNEIKDLPFPQNKLLYVHHHHGNTSSSYGVYLIPVINKPLSSNQYYVIKRHGRHKGEAYASAKDEEVMTCCFCKFGNNIKPRPLDPDDMYQPFEFSIYQTCGSTEFKAKSVATDGHPPYILGGSRWTMYTETPRSLTLGEANGVDDGLRARLPSFEFPVSQQSSPSPVVVGKWYCPFMFIKEKMLPREQVKKSMFYQMTLEQRWERISFQTVESDINVGIVDVVIPSQTVKFEGEEAVLDETKHSGGGTGSGSGSGEVWFKSIYSSEHQQPGMVGLSSLIMERMVWEEERFGWINKRGENNHVSVSRTEENNSEEVGRAKFGCYVLVETFVLRRNDGSLVLTYDFVHSNQVKVKWE